MARRWLSVSLLAVFAGASVAGCGESVKTQLSGCAQLAPDTVTVHRSTGVESNGFTPLTTTSGSAVLARSLLHDFCLTESHQEHLHGDVSCPGDFELAYRGRFSADGKELATFTWDASGCQVLFLTLRGHSTVNTTLVSAASTAAPRLDTDFKQVIGARCVDAIFEPPAETDCR